MISYPRPSGQGAQGSKAHVRPVVRTASMSQDDRPIQFLESPHGYGKGMITFHRYTTWDTLDIFRFGSHPTPHQPYLFRLYLKAGSHIVSESMKKTCSSL